MARALARDLYIGLFAPANQHVSSRASNPRAEVRLLPGPSRLSLYAVAEEVERGELECFRLAGQPRIERRFHIARLARRTPSPSERRFMATVTRCAHHAPANVT
jgi:hypothetical protein